MCEEIIQLMGARNLNGAFFRGAGDDDMQVEPSDVTQLSGD